ncbi:MAG: penicillin acylase family protein [Deltaproteobacteria bacterium]|nr:penicillin acylase family protein [Deltaproteobacteria bacterium]
MFQSRARISCLFVSSLLVLSACGDDSSTPDAAVDAAADSSVDAGPSTTIDGLPITRESSLPDLTQAVDAVQDSRGVWHIYASDMNDALRVEGYLQARDRMGQMDFIRRAATGRTAEYAGSLVPSLIQSDADSRFAGHLRNAQAILPTLGPEDRALLDAYVAGVNAFIAELRSGAAELPRGVFESLPASIIADWSPVDTLAIARFQAASLSFDATDDVALTEALARFRTNFPSDASDPRIARLSGAFRDLYPFEPARKVYVRDGFPNLGTDTGTRARPILPTPPSVSMPLPSLRSLDGAQRDLARLEARFQRFFGDNTRGSNSWVVSGSKTASGNAILANDPHLALISPPLFWQAHINTALRGGDVEAEGQMIAGTPVSLLGFNRHIAWGLTTSGYDVADAYLETITPGTGGAPDTVLFNGAQVPIEKVTETILDDIGGSHEVVFERVPHHGLILPSSRTPTEGISIRWTGDTPSNEAGAFFRLYRASNVDEARDAFHEFEVGGQTLVVATDTGDIYYTSHVKVPVRDARAMTYDPTSTLGEAPCFVLPGTGEYEWTGRLDNRFIPHDLNPTKGFIATANGDAVGVTDDGNPLNDAHFIGCSFDNGHRIARITERLTELTEAGGVTPADLSGLQNDAQSAHGRRYAPLYVMALQRAAEEAATPGTHADLTDIVAGASAADMAKLADFATRLSAWSYDTPAGVEGSPSAEQVADSIATSIFNLGHSRVMQNLIYDEGDWLEDGAFDGERRLSGHFARKLIERALITPEEMQSYDASYPRGGGVTGDTVLWDDISTDAVETRDERIVAAFLTAIGDLEGLFGADVDGWRWGTIHSLRLRALVPATGPDQLSIPTPDDPDFPNGFPRHGDRDVVDAANFSPFETANFRYGSGPNQRLVVEMTPTGPVAVNALPGGNSEDPDSPHQRDQMEDWRHNRVAPVPFEEADVAAAAERRLRFVP